MPPINRALWFIETRLHADLDLAAVARDCGLSPFALARVFAVATGWSVMRYVRARRLSEAAKALRQGAPDILHVAIEARYGSHEAFTRAFCELLGVTPKHARQHPDLHLPLVEPLRMKEKTLIPLPEPRFETRPAFTVAGLGERFTFDTNEGIVGLWQAFVPYLGRIPGEVRGLSYGVCSQPGSDGSFDYLAGVEVSRTDALPPGLRSVKLAAQRYAVFRHHGHISSIHQTFFSLFNHWLPNSGHTAAEAPEFEQYSADFDPVRGTGYVEVWVPLAS